MKALFYNNKKYLVSLVVIIAVLSIYINGLRGIGQLNYEPKEFVILLIAFLIFIPNYYLLYKKPHSVIINIFSIIFLFFLYSLRAYEDLFYPYLWAEDGSVLISDSIKYGLGTIFRHSEQGTLWVLPRIVAFISYNISMQFNSFAATPIIMSIISKTISTIGMYYFTNEKFEWFIAGKQKRFFAVTMIILLLPQNAMDVFDCDCSLPFTLIFDIFLIGLNVFCKEKDYIPTFSQTLFLFLMTVSSAAAPFAAGVIGIGLLRTAYDSYLNRRVSRRIILSVVLKFLLVLSGTLLQVVTILSSEREFGDLNLFNRLILNTKEFMLLPYISRFKSWIYLIIGIIFWIAIFFIIQIKSDILIWFFGFSYVFTFYSAMSMDEEIFYDQFDNIFYYGRFAWISMQIGVLFLLYIICVLLDKFNSSNDGYPIIFSIVAVIVFSLCIIAAGTYNVGTYDIQITSEFNANTAVFNEEGKDILTVNLGPFDPWSMDIPADIESGNVFKDLCIEMEETNPDVLMQSGRICGSIKQINGKIPANLFFKYKNNAYWGAYMLSETGEFEFRFTPGWLIIETEQLEFTAMDEDGNFHSTSLNFE